MKCLLQAAKKKSIIPADFQGAMTSAARRDRVENIRLLREHGIDVNRPDPRDNRGITPLMWTSRDGRVAAARALLELGADVQARSNEGQTAIMYAQGQGHLEMVKLLRAHGARNDATLAGSAASGDTPAAERFLSDGADINAQDKLGWSPLLWACATGQTNTVRLLLESGAQVEVRGEILFKHPDGSGGFVGHFGPLELAANNGHVEVVGLLMRHRSKSKETASDDKHASASAGIVDTEVANSLQIAAEKAFLEVVRVLVDHGADPNAKTSISGVEGSAALLKAAASGNIEMAELLLQYGADPNSYEEPQGDSDYAPTPLDFATSSGNEKMRQLLLQYRADYTK